MRRAANIPLAEASARQVVTDLCLSAPEDIDIELIAAHFGVLVQEDDLSSYEARIVRCGNSAIVTVDRQIAEVGRKRFAIAHELGHFLLHADTRQLALCDEGDLRSWRERVRPEETEANAFGAELLMPGSMVTPRARGQEPSFSLISRLAGDFQTSLTACAIQFVKYTPEPCVLVASHDLKRSWCSANERFREDFRLRHGETIHPYTSCACDLHNAGERSMRASDVPAGAWLDGYDPDGKESVTEDGIVLGSYGLTLSLIWVHEDI